MNSVISGLREDIKRNRAWLANATSDLHQHEGYVAQAKLHVAGLGADIACIESAIRVLEAAENFPDKKGA
jgi:hypothetical protein